MKRRALLLTMSLLLTMVTAPRVMAGHKVRPVFKALELSRTPTTRELMAVGRWGGRLFFPLVLCLLFMMPTAPQAGETPPVFCTGQALELDRVASAWLIKRYVEKDAVFIFFPDGQLISRGTAFDTPDAVLQRTHKQSTFEVILHQYKISEPKLVELTRIIHENEINYWAGNKSSQAVALVRQINHIIKTSEDNQICLRRCFAVFDQFIKGR